jgi:hypothetical protein
LYCCVSILVEAEAEECDEVLVDGGL